jgi:hypothetical protein
MSSGFSSGFSSSSTSFSSMSYAQFSPGLGQIAADFDSGKLAKDLLKGALASAGVGASGSASVSTFGSASLDASSTVSLSVPVQKQVEVSRMVMVPTEKKVMVPTTRQVPDLANAGKLETKGNEVTTPGGYKVKLDGDTAYVTAPNGKQIKVWGDPHIEHSDGKGGKQNIDFRKAATTFMLPDGTRLTMNAYGPDGKASPHGMLGKLDIYNGNKHVTMSNGREGTGRTGGVSTSGVKNDGFAAAAGQATGDVLNVVGDGAQLAYKGRLTKNESVSGTTRTTEWATGAAAGQATVGAQAMHVPMKTVADFKEVTIKGWEQKLVKEYKTVTEDQTFTSTFGAAGSATFGAAGSASVSGNAFAVNGGFGGFGTKNWGDFTLSSVGGAMGGAGLYGSFVNSGASYYNSMSQSHGSSWSSSSVSSFPAQNVAGYISSAAGGAASVLNSYNQTANALSQSSMLSRYGGSGGPGMMHVDWNPTTHTHSEEHLGGASASTDVRTAGGGPGGVDWKDVVEKKTVTEWKTVTESRPVEKIRDLPAKQASTQILFDNAIPLPGADLTRVKPQDVGAARNALAGISADDLRKPGASIDISAFASARGNSAGYNNQALTDRRAEYTANAFRDALREKGLSDSEINGLIKTSANGSTQAKAPEGADLHTQQPDRRTDVRINIPGSQEKYTDYETITKQVPVQREVEVRRRVAVERPTQPIAVAADVNVQTGMPGIGGAGHVEIKQNADGSWDLRTE